MTPLFRILTVARWLVFMCTVTFLCQGGLSQAAEKELVMAIFRIGKTSLGAQYKTILEKGVKVMEKRTGMPLSVKYFDEEKSFLEEIKANKIDFVYTPNYYMASEIAQFAYEPAIGVQVLGRQDAAFCIYIPKISPENNLAKLKGKPFLTYSSQDGFYLISKTVGMAADTFFKPLKGLESGQSMIYALAMGQASGALVDRSNERMMERVNPGPLKKVQRTQCLKFTLPLPPIFVSTKTNPAAVQKMRGILLNLPADPEFKPFLPLVKQMDFQFVKVSRNHVKPLINLYKEAIKKGWKNAYQTWRAKNP